MAGLVLMRAMNQEEIVEIFEQPMTISNEHDVHLQRSRCSSLTVMVMGRSWAFPLSITTTCFEESEEEFLLVRCRQPTTKRRTKCHPFQCQKKQDSSGTAFRWNPFSHYRVECQGSSKRERFVEFILIHEKNRMVALLAVAVNLFLAFRRFGRSRLGLGGCRLFFCCLWALWR